MRQQRRCIAILREEGFTVHNGGYVDVMRVMEIYTGINLMSYDELNLKMPDFEGTMLS